MFNQELEDEAKSIVLKAYEAAPEPLVLFSGGKDSCVLFHVIKKTVGAKDPIKLFYIDSEDEFPEIKKKINHILKHGFYEGREVSTRVVYNKTKTEALRGIKNEVLIVAKTKGEYDGDKKKYFFPLKNWSEIDIWEYIKREHISVPSLYFARYYICKVLDDKISIAEPGHKELIVKRIRFRSLGDMRNTFAIESQADTIDKVIEEIQADVGGERNGRGDGCWRM